MKKTCIIFITAALGVLFILGGLPVVNAQEADVEEFTLEEITVTAEKRSENLQQVPRSLSIITSDDINLRATTTVRDILENTAGIQFFNFFNSFVMRGLSSNTSEAGHEPGVQFNVDGNLALSTMGAIAPMNMSMMDVERVEVLRGPSGAINGRMAAAGTINVVTRDPEFERFNGYAGFTFGNFNTKNANTAFNVPLALSGLDLPSWLENIAFRVSASQDTHSNYIHNTAGEGVGGSQDSLQGRIKVKYSPIEDIAMNWSMTYMRDASNRSMDVPPVNSVITWPGETTPHPEDPWMNANGSKAGIQQANGQYGMSADASWSSRFGTVTGTWSAQWIRQECSPNDPNCVEGDIGQGTYELRMSSPASSKIRWMVGLNTYNKQEYVREESLDAIVEEDINIYYSNNDYGFYGKPEWFRNINPYSNDSTLTDDEKAYYANFYNPDRIEFGTPGLWLDSNGYSLSNNPTGYTGDVDTDSVVFVSQQKERPIDAYAGYASVTVPFLEKHSVTLSMRKDFEKKKKYTVLGVFGTPEGELPHFSFEANENDETGESGAWLCDNCSMVFENEPFVMETEDNPIDYTFGYQYQWKPDILFYTNINTGFRPGGVSPTSIPAQFYEPEKTINYAVGLNSQWFNNRFRLNGEFYLMSIKNHYLNMAIEGPTIWTAPNGVTYEQTFRFSSRAMNMGDMDNYGVELDYDWLITGKDRLHGNFEYKHAYYGDLDFFRGFSTNPPGADQYISFGGRRMAFSPRYTAYASYSHGFLFGNIMVTPQADVRWSDKYFLFQEYWWEAVNTGMVQPAYETYAAYINVAPSDGKWQLNMYGRNLTETVICNGSFMGYSIGDPRTYGVSFTLNF